MILPFFKMSPLFLFLIFQVILISQCHNKGFCKRDSNALIVKCPSPCPRTCEQPYGIPCNKRCRHHGCECRPPHILSKAKHGRCVHPDTCPGKPLCPPNETFVHCKVDCPNNYCSASCDSPPIACDPPHPCPSGCVCKPNYVRRSYDDPRCIPVTECPRPVIEPPIYVEN